MVPLEAEHRRQVVAEVRVVVNLRGVAAGAEGPGAERHEQGGEVDR